MLVYSRVGFLPIPAPKFNCRRAVVFLLPRGKILKSKLTQEDGEKACLICRFMVMEMVITKKPFFIIGYIIKKGEHVFFKE